jgi:hypothetical protein
VRAQAALRKSQEMVSNELPLFPLWYPANLVVANKRIGNIKISGSGDWSFLEGYYCSVGLRFSDLAFGLWYLADIKEHGKAKNQRPKPKPGQS